jgi:TPP-dependent 2-oxoacid decarboxylase
MTDLNTGGFTVQWDPQRVISAHRFQVTIKHHVYPNVTLKVHQYTQQNTAKVVFFLKTLTLLEKTQFKRNHFFEIVQYLSREKSLSK